MERFRLRTTDIGVFDPDLALNLERYDIGYVHDNGALIYTDVLVFCERLRAIKDMAAPQGWSAILPFLLRGRAGLWWISLAPSIRGAKSRQGVEVFCDFVRQGNTCRAEMEKVFRYTYNDTYTHKGVPLGPHLYRHLLWLREYHYSDLPRGHENADLLGSDPQALLSNILITGKVWKRAQELMPGGSLAGLKTVDELVSACNKAWEELKPSNEEQMDLNEWNPPLLENTT